MTYLFFERPSQRKDRKQIDFLFDHNNKHNDHPGCAVLTCGKKNPLRWEKKCFFLLEHINKYNKGL